MSLWKNVGLALAAGSLAMVLAAGMGCSKKGDETVAGGSGGAKLSGKIAIDGSSTVFPITSAVAEEFSKANGDVDVSVAISGTGGGFKKFTVGEIDISNASRPIEKEEMEKAKASNIAFVEIPVAYDGLTVVVNKENTWAKDLTVEELKKMWMPGSTVKSWKDVRPSFPDIPIVFFGAGTDSGTFDYFTKAIVGKEKEIRNDYQASEDDNTLVTGVAGDKGAIGFFGFAYYTTNQDKLNAVSIDNGSGPVAPTDQTISDGSYAPLSRPEFIYVSKKAFDRPEVKAFIDFYLSAEGAALVKEVGYIPFGEDVLKQIRAMVAKGETGTRYGGETAVGKPLADALKAPLTQ